MSAEQPSPFGGDITPNDKLMAALSYPIPIVAIVILLVEDMKNRPFQRYHAIQSLGVNVALWIVISILACVLGLITAGLCAVGPGVLWLVTLYWAYLAYQGAYFEIPWLTQFMKQQRWL